MSLKLFDRWRCLSASFIISRSVHLSILNTQISMPLHFIKYLPKNESRKLLDYSRACCAILPQCSYISSSKPKTRKEYDISTLFQQVDVEPSRELDKESIGAEFSGLLEKESLKRTLNRFYKDPVMISLAEENGLNKKLYHKAYVNFRRFCIESEALPDDLHIVMADMLQGSKTSHISDIFPYFLQHAHKMFPHLECMEDLKHISDLRHPANWYPEARAISRRIIFHAGPTNSGKTHHALKRLFEAKSGIYCGPLRMLASEVFAKANENGTPCDLVTGEDRRYAVSVDEPAKHVSCTVEMTSIQQQYEVAVIDEIQMVRDLSRGWAWTRALLGICAEEVHVCGEPAAVEYVRNLIEEIGEDFEVRKYKRLTSLTVSNKAVGSFDNIEAGDCIVCFRKNDIYHCSRQLESRRIDNAVIYGGLPPGAKLAQAAKFNDPDDACKVMVATDAIGMGLNLNIKRLIFYTLVKPYINENGEKEIDVIPVHSAKQIGGRAGRYGTAYGDGCVAAFNNNDTNLLKELLTAPIDDIQQAGLHPTAEQIELFAYHLPDATLSNLIDIFVALCRVDSNYFICNMEDFKYLADLVEHVTLPLRARYVFCCAPIPKHQPFVCSMFLKFARKYSRGEQIHIEWLYRQIKWPPKVPHVMPELVYLESVFDVLDLYLWLGYRFPDIFSEIHEVKEMEVELDAVIQAGVQNLTKILRNSDSSSSIPDTVDSPECVVKPTRNVPGENHRTLPGKAPGTDRRKKVIPAPKIRHKLSSALKRGGVLPTNKK